MSEEVIVTLKPATSRNTPCHWVRIGNVRLLFSYETVIAASLPGEGRYRIANHWGPTTGRHFNESGTKEWMVLEDDEFAKKVNEYIYKQALLSVAVEGVQ